MRRRTPGPPIRRAMPARARRTIAVALGIGAVFSPAPGARAEAAPDPRHAAWRIDLEPGLADATARGGPTRVTAHVFTTNGACCHAWAQTWENNAAACNMRAVRAG